MSDQLRELRALVLDSHSKAFASYDYDQGFQEMRTFVLGHLDALLAAEPEPDPAPDSEPRSCATCNGTGSLWNGGVESGTCPICEGKGNDPAPDDAFAGAVSRFGVLAEDVGTVRTSIWSRLPESEKGREAPPELVAAIEERESARQRILVLHAQAKHAGLRELRAWCLAQAKDYASETGEPGLWGGESLGSANGMQRVVRQIDAMLKEATDG